MAGTVVAVFKDKIQAERAAQALLETGVPLNDITLVRKDAGGETGSLDVEDNVQETDPDTSLTYGVREVPIHDVEQPINTADEIIPRAVVGMVLGGTVLSLVTSATIFFPGMGLVFAAHPLAIELGSGIVGCILGALAGILTSGGIPAEAAKAYHAHVQSGDTLVTILASSGEVPELQDILRQSGGRRLGYFSRFIDTIQTVES